MGQKVNPHGARVGVIKDWSTRWYADKKSFADNLVSDAKLRTMIKNLEFTDDKSKKPVKLSDAGVSGIDIERRFDNDKTRVTVTMNVAKPGIVIGANGANIEKIKAAIAKELGANAQVILNVQEIKNPDLDAQLVAENIAAQLENRVSFRRAMKKCLQSSMRAGAKGIKTSVSGRLGGADIARSEGYHEGSIPLQTLRDDIDYGFAEAKTAYGRIGVKVWIYKGEVLSQTLRTTPRTMDTSKPYQERRERRPRRDGDRRQGGFNRGGQGGFNRDRQNGGFNRNGQGRPQGGFNRNGQGRPAAPAKEGGAQ